MKITFLVSGSIRSNFSYRPLAMARSLHARGHDVSIIAPKADKYNLFVPETIEHIDGVKILQPFQFLTKRLEINLIPYLFGACRLLVQSKPDLVYIYKPTPISVIGLVARFFGKAEIVADFDDLGSEVMRIEGHPSYQRALVAWSEHIAAKYADRLIVASSYLSEMYAKQFPYKPILTIPNGIESDWLTSTTPTKEAARIVFMGSINRKNILEPLFDSLCEVIVMRPHTSVLIIGGGSFLTYFKEKAEQLSIAKYITFTGWLDIEEAKKQLHAGDIGYNFMPDEITTRAASNMKVPQYMSRGVVPLVSNVGDLAKTVDFGKAGYVCEANTKSLKETLLMALEDPERSKKAEHAKYIATHELNWNTFAENFDRWMYPVRAEGKKKIYTVSTTVPGNVGGGEIRNYHIANQLITQAHADVEIFCITSKANKFRPDITTSTLSSHYRIVESRPLSILGKVRAILWERVIPSFYEYRSSSLATTFRRACEKLLPDIVLIEQTSAYYAIRPHIAWLQSKGVIIIFDCHNVEFQTFKDSLAISSLLKKITGKFLLPNLKKIEIEAAHKADLILACSAENAEFFKRYNQRVFLVPNGVDVSEFNGMTHGLEPVILFIGGTEYPPNADAVKYYLTEIHPIIKKEIPHVKFLAVGVTAQHVADLGITDSSVSPLGFVEDVRPYLAQARIGICPVRYGSGTRIKIMTYMIAGLPVVSTAKGAEGVVYTHHENILIADDAQAFAQGVLSLLNDPAEYESIARNGHKFIVDQYDWNSIGKTLAHILTTQI